VAHFLGQVPLGNLALLCNTAPVLRRRLLSLVACLSTEAAYYSCALSLGRHGCRRGCGARASRAQGAPVGPCAAQPEAATWPRAPDARPHPNGAAQSFGGSNSFNGVFLLLLLGNVALVHCRPTCSKVSGGGCLSRSFLSRGESNSTVLLLTLEKWTSLPGNVPVPLWGQVRSLLFS